MDPNDLAGWMTREGPRITGLFAATTRFLANGDDLHQARLDLIRSAKRCIYISAYSFQPDQAGGELLGELCARARAGVDVRLLLDGGFGSTGIISRAGVSSTQQMLFSSGARVLGFYGATPDVLHDKLLLVDGSRYITGGSGYADNYRHASRSSPVWHDMDVLVSGPSACYFHNRFINAWYEAAKDTDLSREGQPAPLPDVITWSYDAADPPLPYWYGDAQDDPGKAQWQRQRFGLESFQPCTFEVNDDNRAFMSGHEKLVPIYANPYFAGSEERPTLHAHLSAIAAARNEIHIWSPYFIPHPQVVQALAKAAASGVKVTVLTNSKDATDEKSSALLMAAAMFRQIPDLLGAGVDIRLWPGPSTLHRKGALFDGRLAFLGSDNFDVRGQDYSSESIIYTDSPALCATLGPEFAADVALAAPLTAAVIAQYTASFSLIDELVGTEFYSFF